MRKVAVLGGGMAGLTAAWSLSQPDDDDMEITVYQRGWRLGGKGASSRGANGRIEEHGLHIWLGYYDNAFRLMRQVYSELDRPTTDPTCAIRTFDDAFSRADKVGVEDNGGTNWAHWVATFSRSEGEPGTAENDNPDSAVGRFVRRAFTLLLDFSASRPVSRSFPAIPPIVLSGSPDPPVDHWRDELAVEKIRREVEIGAMVAALEAIALVSAAGTRSSPAGFLLDRLESLRDQIADQVQADDDSRRAAELANLVVTCVKGIIADQLLTDPRGFAAIDHLDFREWLLRHGAVRQTCDSALIRGLYDLVFAYEAGDPQRPRFSAGLGLFLSEKLFFEYRGSIFWHMQAGMGDIVFAALYQALRRRGVRFEFFRRIDQIHLGPDGRQITAISVGCQAQLAQGVTEYDPLIRVGDVPCFPAAPRVEQLAEPVGDDLEKHWSDRRSERDQRLELGRDFDDVVLAVSVGMVPHVCPQLIEDSPRWRDLVRAVATVPTQSLQLWLRPDDRELGWPYTGATVSGYDTPFDTYASMSHLIERESWPGDDRPQSLAYFCGALSAADVEDPAIAHARVRQHAVEFLSHRATHFWPAAAAADGGFRWEMLCSAGRADSSNSEPAANSLDSQYWQANIDPSDRYVQSLPGTAVYRLRADQSGYANLFLAGDWINSGLNAGCIEAAVMSGIQAANALRGIPLTTSVLGNWYGLGTS